jgi:hypothetical protein
MRRIGRVAPVTSAAHRFMCLWVSKPEVQVRLQNAEGLLDQALRVFGLLGAVLVAVVEVELEAIISLVRITEYWSGRAIVQVGFDACSDSYCDYSSCSDQVFLPQRPPVNQASG